MGQGSNSDEQPTTDSGENHAPVSDGLLSSTDRATIWKRGHNSISLAVKRRRRRTGSWPVCKSPHPIRTQIIDTGHPPGYCSSMCTLVHLGRMPWHTLILLALNLAYPSTSGPGLVFSILTKRSLGTCKAYPWRGPFYPRTHIVEGFERKRRAASLIPDPFSPRELSLEYFPEPFLSVDGKYHTDELNTTMRNSFTIRPIFSQEEKKNPCRGATYSLQKVGTQGKCLIYRIPELVKTRVRDAV